jgi:phage portal protein BeeE
LDFLTHTVQPWLRRIEVALSSIMVGSDIAFDTSSLLRTDALTRARVDQSLVMMGAKSPNEVRQGLGLEPYVGGDVFNQAMAGAITAGGDNPSLGEDADTSAPVMGVLN